MSDTSLPSATEELWRYSRIADFPLDRFSAAKPSEPVRLPARAVALLEALGVDEASALVCVDGFVQSSPSIKGLTIEVQRQAPAALCENASPFCKLFADSISDAIEVVIGENATHIEQLVVLHVASQASTVSFPSVKLRVGANASVKVVEVVVSDVGDLTVVPQTSVELGAGANVRYVNLQLLDETAWQFGFQTSIVGQDAVLDSTSVAWGGYYARVETESHLGGKGGEARLNALYFGTGDQMHDFRTLQAHDAPKTTSDLLFKGAVANTARSVYSGLIRVTKGAAGTRAFQTNRNLVLSDGAHADSVPNLEIDEQDVACSHASAVGPVDSEQLFYLESRGVPTGVARRLVVLGFLGELVDRTGVAGLNVFIDGLLGEKLERAGIELINFENGVQQ